MQRFHTYFNNYETKKEFNPEIHMEMIIISDMFLTQI